MAKKGTKMLIEELTHTVIDWNDFEAAGELSRRVLQELDEDRAAIRNLVQTREGIAVVGVNGTTLVLGQWPEQGFELLLHLFQPFDQGRPHSHRRCFSTRILNGGYRHTWFGKSDEHEQSTNSALVPYLTRFETAGSTYTLHPTAVHSIDPSPDTVALTICEPGSSEAAPGEGTGAFGEAVADIEHLRVI